MPNYVTVYTALSRNVTQTLIASGKPFLPSDTWLNVNFPDSTSSSCTKASQFQFVLSTISSTTSPDTKCGGDLPLEADVVGADGCYASISVAVASTKADASASVVQGVQKKLNGILSCLPSS